MSDRGAVLLGLAREAIATSFVGGDVTPPPLTWLEEPRAAFVTLRDRHGELRGCIGTIEARHPLGEAVIDAARGAAFRDGRFAPLKAGELAGMRIDVSVLSPMTALHVSSEADAIDQLARTKPGVLLSCGGRRSVLLPKVWISVPHAADFLRLLKLKAGLPATFWSDEVTLQVFTSDDVAEPAAPAPAETTT
jgi:AmmeMemoRadiSam system protein A